MPLQFDDVFHDITYRHHAHDPVVFDHRQMADVFLHHDAHAVFQVVVRTHRDRVGCPRGARPHHSRGRAALPPAPRGDRVDPARSRTTGGTGLGLSIVKHIITNHGGDITVWSVPGEGSTFTIRLPEFKDSKEQVDSANSSPMHVEEK